MVYYRLIILKIVCHTVYFLCFCSFSVFFFCFFIFWTVRRSFCFGGLNGPVPNAAHAQNMILCQDLVSQVLLCNGQAISCSGMTTKYNRVKHKTKLTENGGFKHEVRMFQSVARWLTYIGLLELHKSEKFGERGICFEFIFLSLKNVF